MRLAARVDKQRIILLVPHPRADGVGLLRVQRNPLGMQDIFAKSPGIISRNGIAPRTVIRGGSFKCSIEGVFRGMTMMPTIFAALRPI